MNQQSLFQNQVLIPYVVEVDSVKGTFTPLAHDAYEVVLEINSNKFLIHATHDWQMGAFEILACKGFVELSLHLVATVREIISLLFNRVPWIANTF